MRSLGSREVSNDNSHSIHIQTTGKFDHYQICQEIQYLFHIPLYNVEISSSKYYSQRLYSMKMPRNCSSNINPRLRL